MFKKIAYITLFILSTTFSISTHADTILGPNRIEKNTIFTKAKSPYIVQQNISVKDGVYLSVEKDATIIFDGGSFFLNNANFSGESFVIKTKEQNRSHSFLISGDNSKIHISHVSIEHTDRPLISAWNNSSVDISFLSVHTNNNLNISGIQVFDNSKLTIINSDFSGFSKALDVFNTTYATVTDSVFFQNTHAVYTFDSYMFFRANDFVENNIAIEFFTKEEMQGLVDAQHNWWGNTERPLIHMWSSDVLRTDINALVGNIIYTPWNIVANKKYTQGNVSSILFLPGLMGSRLYQKDTFENQLWEPNRNKDVKKLYLNQLGESIEKNIYTRDVLAKTNIAGGISSIEKTPYKDFFTYMDGLVKSNIISNWKAAPYDWRYSPDTILEQGVLIGNTKGEVFTDSIVAEVLLLAKTSKTRKVTIVTHSNGGIVGKQLMIELKKKNLDSLIDKIIFVAIPEYGTPQAITSLLYGHEQAIAGGLILSASVAQKLGVNMPTAYTLLPSEKYFSNGNNIAIGKNYVQDKNNLNIRLTEKGLINNYILHKADIFHSYVDQWVPSPHLSVYQIVGTGLLTLDGFMENSEGKPMPTYTTSGDGVVQDMYIKSNKSYNRTGKTFAVDLYNTKYTHIDIMNNTKIMKHIDSFIRKSSIQNQIVDTVEESSLYPEHSNEYTLFQINSSFSTTSSLSGKNIQAQKIITKDTLSYIPTNQFNITKNNDSLSRYNLFGNTIHYITQDYLQNIDILENKEDIVDLHVFKKENTITTESVYKDINMFSGSSVLFRNSQSETSQREYVEVVLPLLNQQIEINKTKKITYNQNNEISIEEYSTSTQETLLERVSRIKKQIQSSNITSYIKSRYMSRVDMAIKNNRVQDLDTLRQKAEQSIRSINSFSNSPALKGRYSKLKQDYIYLSYILK